MTRAMGEGSGAEDDGRFIRNHLIEIMWRDVDVRLSQLKDTKRSALRKQTRELGGQFQYALILYDEALLSDDKVLANALWLRVFDCDCDDLVKIEMLVEYVRKTVCIVVDHGLCVTTVIPARIVFRPGQSYTYDAVRGKVS